MKKVERENVQQLDSVGYNTATLTHSTEAKHVRHGAGALAVRARGNETDNPKLPPPPYPPVPPFSPSLISVMVSVDVKYHVYLLFTRLNNIPGLSRCSVFPG